MKKFLSSSSLLAAVAAAAAFALPTQALAAVDVSKSPSSSALFSGSPFSPASQVPASVVYHEFDVSGIYSYEFIGDPLNEVYYINVGAFAQVTEVAWDVTIYADAPSWLSEMTLTFSGTDLANAVSFRPGAGVNNSGTGSYAGSASLIDLDLSFAVGADGLLRLEFHETSWNDWAGDWDGLWESGTVTFGVSPIPEPGTYGLMALGMLAIGAAARRRRNQA